MGEGEPSSNAHPGEMDSSPSPIARGAQSNYDGARPYQTSGSSGSPSKRRGKKSNKFMTKAQSSSSGPASKSKGGGGGGGSGSSQASDVSQKRKRGVFQKDLQHMMYGFGDDPNPLPESVALVEDIVTEYVTDLVHKAQEVACKRGKLLTEDFLYLIRKDMPKLNRCTELLSMHEELKQARKAFDLDEEKLASSKGA